LFNGGILVRTFANRDEKKPFCKLLMEDIMQWKWTSLELCLFAGMNSVVVGHHLGAAYAKNSRENVLDWFHIRYSALRTAAN
jgi:hypothetical protein